MKLGFLTACLRSVPLEDLVKWSSENGFGALEVACWPLKSDRDYAGSSIDVKSLNKGKAEEIENLFSKNNIEISCLTYCDNNLSRDSRRRKENLDHLKKVIDAAQLLSVRNVSTFIGRDETKTIKENLEEAKRIFSDIVKYAEDRGVRIAIENCPMPGWQFEGLAGNVAYSPEIWDELFGSIPSESFGLNLDPSHLYWLGIDYIRAVKDYSSKIFHVHAKDTEILEDRLSRVGTILSRGWWRYRMPGLGEIEWGRFISALAEAGYDYVLSTEHEDPVWEGSEEKVKNGLILGRRYLSNFVV
ncbi:MAG: sugar phosphate isomerase/epimerase family protein [bacterium]